MISSQVDQIVVQYIGLVHVQDPYSKNKTLFVVQEIQKGFLMICWSCVHICRQKTTLAGNHVLFVYNSGLTRDKAVMCVIERILTTSCIFKFLNLLPSLGLLFWQIGFSCLLTVSIKLKN